MNFFYHVQLPIEAVLSVLIIFSNIIGILAITSSREKIISSSHLIINLSVSDLLVGCSIIYVLIIDSRVFESTKISCLLRPILLLIVCVASFNSIIVIAIDRYVAIIYPQKYSKFVTKNVITCTLSVVWVIALVLAVVLFFWNDYDTQLSCTIKNVVPSAFVKNIFVPWILITWLSIIILYFLIWSKVRSHAQKLQISRKRNTDKAVLIIIGCFTLCWLPSAVIDFLPIPEEYELLVYSLAYWIAFSNCAMNPFIYALKIPAYRKACYRLFSLKSRT